MSCIICMLSYSSGSWSVVHEGLVDSSWHTLSNSVHTRGWLRAFPHLSQCASSKVLIFTKHIIYLLHYRSCFLLMVAWHSDFRNAKFGVQYFWNPSTGMSANLVTSQRCIRCFYSYTQVRHLFGCFSHLQPGSKLHPPPPNRSWP